MAMALTMFIMLYTASIVYMPTEITDPLNPQIKDIPDEFNYQNAVGYYTSRVQNISLDESCYSVWSLIDFDPSITYTNNTFIMGNASKRYYFMWSSMTDNIELVGFDNPVSARWFHVDYAPVIDRLYLVSNWDNQKNITRVDMRSLKDVVGVFFRDTNMTRNDIGFAYDEGSLSVELMIYSGDDAIENDIRELRDGWSLLRSIATFKLDQEYENASPILGYFLSVIFYVPLLYLAMWGINVVVHGGM